MPSNDDEVTVSAFLPSKHGLLNVTDVIHDSFFLQLQGNKPEIRNGKKQVDVITQLSLKGENFDNFQYYYFCRLFFAYNLNGK